MRTQLRRCDLWPKTALRRLGFKGSGQRYELPSDVTWATLGFQKSAYSDSLAARFTINVTVISRDV